MKNSMFFLIFAIIGLVTAPIAQAETAYTGDVSVKSKDVFDNGRVIWDNAVLQATGFADFGNGWRTEAMASLGNGASMYSDSNGSRVSFAGYRDMKMGKFAITAGLAYHDLRNIRNTNQDVLIPSIYVSMPTGSNTSLFTEAKGYIVKNGKDGTSLEFGGSLNHKIMGIGANHSLSVLRDNTSLYNFRKGTLAVYSGELTWKKSKNMTIHPLNLRIIGEKNQSAITVVGAGLTYKF